MKELSVISCLPRASDKRIAMRIKPAAERALRNGHPWLFENAIRKQNREGNAGDLAVIFDRKDRFLAVGLYDPASEIRVKVLQHNQKAAINRSWFADKMQTALTRRSPLASSGTTGYRMIYGEGDGFPGLVMDRYADVVVVKLYSLIWLPHLRDLLDLLDELYGPASVVLRLGRSMNGAVEQYGLQDGMTLSGSEPKMPVQFTENGLRFAANVVHGHKTGFFFDHRDNRERVRSLTSSASVLDVFAYTGAFSLNAAYGGAREVVSVDMSEPALQAAKHNFSLNQHIPSVAHAKHTVMVTDAFEGLQALKEQGRLFDVVIVDPPSFAKSQAEVEGALRAYARLAALSAGLVKSGGWWVTASCSSRISTDDFLATVTNASGRTLYNQQVTGHALDHPVTFPEGKYLKCVFTQLS